MRLLAPLAVCLLCWTVSAQPLRVLDGDTFIAAAAIWPASGVDQVALERVRVLGVDTPERSGATKSAGETAKAFTAEWLAAAGGNIRLEVCKRDSFGRVLAVVTRPSDGRTLATDLIAAGLGVPVP